MTSEGNNLIAAFDGKAKVHPNDLKYDSSWDWLMPVVEKIREMGHSVTIEFNRLLGCGVFINPIQIKGSYKKDINPLEVIWLAVVDFIKWYNKTNQQ